MTVQAACQPLLDRGFAETILQERLNALEHPDAISVLSDSRILRQQLAAIEDARVRLLQPSS